MMKWFNKQKGEMNIAIMILLAIAIILVVQFYGAINSANNFGMSSIPNALNLLTNNGYTVWATGGLLSGQVPYANSSTTLAGSSKLTYSDTGTGTITTGTFAGNASTSTTATNLSGGIVSATSVTDSGLTSGRIPIAGTGGLLGDNSNLTFGSNTLIATTANITTLNAPTGGSTTYSIAASDATDNERRHADVVLTGTNDYILIQAMLNALGDHSTLKIVGSTVNLGATGITVAAKQFFTLIVDADVNYTGNSTAISLTGTPTYGDSYYFKRVLAAGSAISSATARGIYMTGLFNFSLTATIQNFKVGAGLELFSDSSTGLNLEWGNNINLTFYDCLKGIYCTGNLPTAWLDINRIFYQIIDTSLSGYKAIDVEDNTYNALEWHIGQMIVYPDVHVGAAVSGSYSTKLNIRELIVDGYPSGAASFICLNAIDATTSVDLLHFWGMPTATKVSSNTNLHCIKTYYQDGIKVWDDQGTTPSNTILVGKYMSPTYLSAIYAANWNTQYWLWADYLELSRPKTFDRIAITVTTNESGKSIRLGVYNCNDDLSAGSLILDAGTVSFATTGFKEITLSPALTLNKGKYYLAAISNTAVGAGQVEFYQIYGTGNGVQDASSDWHLGGGVNVYNLSVTEFNALPSTLPAAMIPQFWYGPVVGMRVLSNN